MPAAVGMAVCQVGTTSKVYDGRCVPTLGGAYIGALGVLPGLLLGVLAGCSSSSSSQSSGDDNSVGLEGLDSCVTNAVIGGALGLTIGTLVGAYSGWRIFRRPKPGTPPCSAAELVHKPNLRKFHENASRYLSFCSRYCQS